MLRNYTSVLHRHIGKVTTIVKGVLRENLVLVYLLYQQEK